MRKMNTPKTSTVEFDRFMLRISEAFPKDEIILIALNANSKAPMSKILWEKNPVRPEAARNLSRLGTNLGIVASENNSLVLVDADCPELIGEMPPTLTIKSRMRTHEHYVYKSRDLSAKLNINTEIGGIRSNMEYVVTPGSFVPVSKEELRCIPKEEQLFAGQYTIANDLPVADLIYDDLPIIFKNAIEEKHMRMLSAEERQRDREEAMEKDEYRRGKSALNYLTFFDILPNAPFGGGRFEAPEGLHDTPSATGNNASVSPDGRLYTCWRCGAVMNPYTYLAVLAGIGTCAEMGAEFGNHCMGLDSSSDETKFKIWQKAREMELLPDEDSLPVAVTRHIALNEGLCEEGDLTEEGMIPLNVFITIRKLIEEGLY
jgi:hypothetical protein